LKLDTQTKESACTLLIYDTLLPPAQASILQPNFSSTRSLHHHSRQFAPPTPGDNYLAQQAPCVTVGNMVNTAHFEQLDSDDVQHVAQHTCMLSRNHELKNMLLVTFAFPICHDTPQNSLR